MGRLTPEVSTPSKKHSIFSLVPFGDGWGQSTQFLLEFGDFPLFVKTFPQLIVASLIWWKTQCSLGGANWSRERNHIERAIAN
jgi:hypothetical protein